MVIGTLNIAHKRNNKIMTLRDANREQKYDSEKFKEMTKRIFSDIFHEDQEIR